VPTYDYECQKCKYTFEHFKSISEPDPKRCPECKGKLKRLIGTGAGIIFKGPGFYETDYRSSEYKKEEKKDREASKTAKSEKSEKCTSCCKSSGKDCPRN